jgi:hypothetical protein
MTSQQPVLISSAIGGVLSTGVALAAVLWPDRLEPILQAAIIAFGNSVILTAGAIYAFLKSTPVANPTLPPGSVVNVQGSEDKVEIQPTPPGPAAIEGGGVG